MPEIFTEKQRYSRSGNLSGKKIEGRENTSQSASQTGQQIERSEPAGQAMSTEVGNQINYNVPGIVPLVEQPSNMTCWATVGTMMMSWHESASFPIAEVMYRAGAYWRNKFDSNEGLSIEEKPGFLSAVYLQDEPPMCYTVEGLLALLENNGPLWVTTDEQPGAGFAIHARIITGIYGDGTNSGTFLRINDPDGGRQVIESFGEFTGKFEEVAEGGLRIQVVHY
jgi:hypothetical protein